MKKKGGRGKRGKRERGEKGEGGGEEEKEEQRTTLFFSQFSFPNSKSEPGSSGRRDMWG